MSKIIIIAWVFLIGLAGGSFVNALVWRLKNRRNFVSERSICPKCEHVLAWYDLVPVLSWLSLLGRCRYCSAKIEDSPIVEVFTGLAFVVSYMWWPYELSNVAEVIWLGLWFVQVVCLMALAVFDMRWMILPNKLLLPMSSLAVLQGFYRVIVFGEGWSVILSMLAGFMVGGGFFYFIFAISNGRWIGGGDVKMGAYMGLLLGPVMVLLAIMSAFYMASLLLLPLFLLKKVTRKSKIPFGPFLIAGLFIVMVFGEEISSFARNYYGLS